MYQKINKYISRIINISRIIINIKMSKKNQKVEIQLLNSKYKLEEPIFVNKIVKTAKEWKKLLTSEQYEVARRKATGKRTSFDTITNTKPTKKQDIYCCVCCDLPLFSGDTKFESGTGWPSFYIPLSKYNVKTKIDKSAGMIRTAVSCTRCDCHLGHLFNDGPPPTGLRYCLNYESLKL
jgi:peptide-methionine (R)-S-oxide reductase